jgi:hypothetical protein
LIRTASTAPKRGFREKDHEKRNVAVYREKAFQSLLRKDLEGTMALDAWKKGDRGPLLPQGDSTPQMISNLNKRPGERLCGNSRGGSIAFYRKGSAVVAEITIYLLSLFLSHEWLENL